MKQQTRRNDIKQFRKSNINAMIKLSDQSVIMGRGGGYSIDGTSTESVRWAIHFRNILLKVENFIKDELKKDSECLLGITDLTNYYREGKDIVVSDNDKTKRYRIIEIPVITFKQ